MADFNVPSFAIPPLITYESMFKGIIEWIDYAKTWPPLSDSSHRGFLNIPFNYDWTLFIFLFIMYIKCNIVLHGMKYKHPFTLRMIRWLLPLFKLLSRALPVKEKYSVPFVDEESLFYGLYDYEVQACMSIFTVAVVCNPHCALILDICFLGVCFWHLLHLYRNNMKEYIILWTSLIILYKEKHLFSEGVSWVQLYYLLVMIYVVMNITLPNKINLDLVLFYYCAILYITYRNYVSISQHGFVPAKPLKEYLALSWTGQTISNLTKMD